MREEEKNQSSQINKFFKKRWVFPAIYLVSAALLISMIMWFQASNSDTAKAPDAVEKENTAGVNKDEPAIEVNKAFENFAMPVQKEDDARIVTHFFEPTASMEEQEKALIVNGNQYRPSMGLDIANKEGKEFKVVAALSGKVAAVRQDALLGNVIEIEHENGIMTVYQSVKDIKVKEGDAVKQGEELATSSTSQFNQAVENHVHFEIRKDQVAVNPLSYFGEPAASLLEADKEEAEAADDHSEDVSEDESAGELLPN